MSLNIKTDKGLIKIGTTNYNDLTNKPIVKKNDGTLSFEDEYGNTLSQINREGVLSAKDFVVGSHKLSEKANVSDIPSLNGFATQSWVTSEIDNESEEIENWVKEQKYLTQHQDISHLATKNEIPSLNGYATETWVNNTLNGYATKDEVSDLVDMSVIETLIGDDDNKSVREIANDELGKQLLNDNFESLQELSTWLNEQPDKISNIDETLQKHTSDIANIEITYKNADSTVLSNANAYTDESIEDLDFYHIKNNPIVDGEVGSLTFVDENGYLGLKVTEDGLIVKDVVTPDHILSNKADKSFVEDNYYNKSVIDKKITEAVTGGQVSLDGFATEQWVNEQGFIKNHQDISHLASKDEIPTKVSDLENDKNYITIDDIPEIELPSMEEYVTKSELNAKGYLTEHQDISHLASKDEIPIIDGLASEEYVNNKIDGYVKEEDLPEFDDFATKVWVNGKGYVNHDELLNLSFNDIKGSPITIDNSGEINFIDESGNIGFKVDEDGLYVKDVMSGNHRLSEKANATDIPSKTSQLTNDSGFITKSVVTQAINAIGPKQDVIEDLESIREGASLGMTALQEVPEEYAKLSDLPIVPSMDDYATREWVNNKSYVQQSDLLNISINDLNDTPIVEDSKGEINFIDGNGNIGLKVNNKGLFVQDVTAGEHILSEKANQVEVDNMKNGFSAYQINGGTLNERQYQIMSKYLYTPFIISSTDTTIIPDSMLNENKTDFFCEWFWNCTRITGGEPIMVTQWSNSIPYKIKGIVTGRIYVIDFNNKTISPE